MAPGEAMAGLLRVVAPDGIVVASVMSWLGTWRCVLPAIIDLDGQSISSPGSSENRTASIRCPSGCACFERITPSR